MATEGAVVVLLVEITVGMIEGIREDKAEGAVDGKLVVWRGDGLLEGEIRGVVGETDGFDVGGLELGAGDGGVLGLPDGAPGGVDGKADGIDVGISEGRVVGKADGCAVGRAVGRLGFGVGADEGFCELMARDTPVAV